MLAVLKKRFKIGPRVRGVLILSDVFGVAWSSWSQFIVTPNYASPKKEGRGWASRYTLSFHTSIMAYGYYQQSGMPGWGTNQAILVNCVPLFRLTFSFSFGSELHLLQVFSLNPPVSPGYEDYKYFLVVTRNTGGGTDFYRAHASTSDPSVPMVTFFSIATYEWCSIGIFLITLGIVYVSLGVLLLAASVLVFTKQGTGIVVPMGV